MEKNGELEDYKKKEEPSNLKLLLYGQPQLAESRIYYSSQTECYQLSLKYLKSLENVEILREYKYSEIDYDFTKQDGKEPYWKGKLKIQPEELGSKIKFNFDFKEYYKQNIKLVLKGSIFVVLFLIIIIGSYNLLNLIEPWFILTNLGIVGACILFIGAFILDSSEDSQHIFMNNCSSFLDGFESQLITKALEEFRSKQIKEIVPNIPPKEIICNNCHAINKYSSNFCIKCGISLIKCSICLSKIAASEEILECPSCHSLAHKTHLLEWLKIKGCCPVCRNPLKSKNNQLI